MRAARALVRCRGKLGVTLSRVLSRITVIERADEIRRVRKPPKSDLDDEERRLVIPSRKLVSYGLSGTVLQEQAQSLNIASRIVDSTQTLVDSPTTTSHFASLRLRTESRSVSMTASP